jgi:hypothetical protein
VKIKNLKNIWTKYKKYVYFLTRAKKPVMLKKIKGVNVDEKT